MEDGGKKGDLFDLFGGGVGGGEDRVKYGGNVDRIEG